MLQGTSSWWWRTELLEKTRTLEVKPDPNKTGAILRPGTQNSRETVIYNWAALYDSRSLPYDFLARDWRHRSGGVIPQRLSAGGVTRK